MPHPTLEALIRTVAGLSLRATHLLIFLACIGLLGFGLYLQHVVGLEPCPMCIVQRYALTGVGIAALIGALSSSKRLHFWFGLLVAVIAAFGAFVAARQSWLQWFPPEIMTCGRDFYGMIESFPLQRVIPMIFRGSGDCAAIDWTFLGLTIANWSFLWLVFITVAVLVQSWRRCAG